MGTRGQKKMARNWLLLVKVFFLVAQPSLSKPSNFLVFTKDNNQEGSRDSYTDYLQKDEGSSQLNNLEESHGQTEKGNENQDNKIEQPDVKSKQPDSTTEQP